MSSNALSNHFEGRYRISELVFVYTLAAFVSEILLVRTISASSTYG